MCWSGEASAVLATVGLTSTGIAALRRQPTPLWATLFRSWLPLLLLLTGSALLVGGGWWLRRRTASQE